MERATGAAAATDCEFGFDSVFLIRLERLLAEQHPLLQLEIPANSFSGPTPDFVVSNPSTGALLVGRLKSGFQAEHIPLTTWPYLRAMRDRFASENGDVVLITTGKVPELVRSGLDADGIGCFQVRSPEEATARLESRLHRLDAPSA